MGQRFKDTILIIFRFQTLTLPVFSIYFINNKSYSCVEFTNQNKQLETSVQYTVRKSTVSYTVYVRIVQRVHIKKQGF